jgi:uncharacterized protein with GYD domain
MATYIALINWTDKGISEAKDTVQRAEKVRQMAQQLGGDMPTIYWTMGRYDIVAVVEAPDDETATAILLRAASLGTVRSETLRAFTADELPGIFAKLG